MRAGLLVLALLVCTISAAPVRAADPTRDVPGLEYRFYAGLGYRFQPLLSFGNLNGFVSARDAQAVRRLAHALLARGVRRGDALYWEYDFRFAGGPPRWSSGFAQAVAAEALARSSLFLGDRELGVAADAAFRALQHSLLMPIAGGSWIREYGYTSQVILNAQLESILALDWYARIHRTPAARRVAADLRRAALRLLPRFDLGCWGLYELGGARASVHYQAYHVDLLRRLALRHREPLWHATYVRWKRCLPPGSVV